MNFYVANLVIPTSRRLSGFTLTELIVTIAIAAILMAIAMPDLVTPVATTRLRTVAEEFANAIDVGRSNAILLRNTVTVCPRLATGGCQAGAPDWNSGWVLFKDSDSNGQFGGNDTLLKVHSTISGHIILGAGNTNPIMIDETGAVISQTSGASNTRTIKLTDTRSGTALYVVIGRYGRAQILLAADCRKTNSGCVYP